MPFKVWIEIEEVNEEGDEIEGADSNLAFALPFASSARVETLQEALNIAVDMHNRVNDEGEDYVQVPQEAT